MADNQTHQAASSDNVEIHALIDRWATAVREVNLEAIRADHDPDILMFDVPPPFLSRGLDAYMATWNLFFSCSEMPIVFELHDVTVTADRDVAFATAIGKCTTLGGDGKREALEFRLTMGFRRIDGHWRITHEHHSLPAE